jgi:hypothetical protein
MYSCSLGLFSCLTVYSLSLGLFLSLSGHPTNLFRAPYCLADALAMWKDGEKDTYMGLWKIGKDDPPLIGASESCLGSYSTYELYENVK